MTQSHICRSSWNATSWRAMRLRRLWSFENPLPVKIKMADRGSEYKVISVLTPTRITVALVSKSSEICEIYNSGDDDDDNINIIIMKLDLRSKVRTHDSTLCESKKWPPLKLFAIFSLKLSIFPWNFASMLTFHIYTYLLILVNLS